MEQQQALGPVESAVGYVLKQAAVALRASMEAALRPLQLTVPQYACLELLGQRPGLSNAELARGVFVSRQSMNLVLRGLEDRGLVLRAATAPHGRELPAELTPSGRDLLAGASAAVNAVQAAMCAGIDSERQQDLLETLGLCIENLRAGSDWVS